MRTAALAIFSVLLATSGQLLLKSGMDRVGYVGRDRLSKPIRLIAEVASEPRVVGGLLIFVVSAAVWLIVLSRMPLSVAYPFAGLTYVFIVVFSKFVLDEPVPSLRWAGVFLIITGIALIGGTAPPGVE